MLERKKIYFGWLYFGRAVLVVTVDAAFGVHERKRRVGGRASTLSQHLSRQISSFPRVSCMAVDAHVVWCSIQRYPQEHRRCRDRSLGGEGLAAGTAGTVQQRETFEPR